MSNNSILKVAFLGAGRVTQRHIDAISKRTDAKIVAAADPVLEAAQKLAEPHGAEATQDSESLLHREDIDIFYICTPHYLHHRYAMDALGRGKHVFIEKPLANTVEECEQINALATASNLVVGVGHHQRYIPSMKRFGQLLREGAIGEVRMINDRMVVNNSWNTRAPWWKQKATAGGGMLMNVGVHQIDRTLWLAGKLPRSVYSHTHCGVPEIDVDTDYSIMLGVPGNVTINIMGTSYPCDGSLSFEAIGTDGHMWLEAGEDKIYRTRGQETTMEHVAGYFEAAEDLTNGFFSSIRSGNALEVGGAWGEVVVRIAQLAYQSSETGQSVELSLPSRLHNAVGALQ